MTAKNSTHLQQLAQDIPRSSGVLMHVTSLPNEFAIGDLGPAAYRWVDTLAKAKQRWWQILPLGPPGAGYSPYQCFSAFAGNTDLISPALLVREGLVTRAEIKGLLAKRAVDRIDPARASKRPLLNAAIDRVLAARIRTKTAHLRDEFEAFCASTAWLDDYALFMAVKDRYPTQWQSWPRRILRREPATLEDLRRDLRQAYDLHRFGQFIFARQLRALKTHATERGVQLIGDIPIFVSPDSADVWARPELFELDRQRLPRAVAGVPPDMFSATGQRWGNPLYNWDAMERDGFQWWIDRVRATLEQVDLVRMDHFRGFAGYWRIPAKAPTAETGKWVKAPGKALFTALRKAIGKLPFIAEDLGVITPDVEALRDEFGLPGMRVLQFAFGGGDNPFLPHNYPTNSVAYTGTHDNDTTAGWFRSADRETRKRIVKYAPEAKNDAAWALMRLAWGSVAKLAIAPVQDLLRLGNKSRMNLPGTATGNWTWRMREDNGALRARAGCD